MLMAALFLAASSSLDTTLVHGPPTCPRCRIVTTPVAILGPVDGIPSFDYGAFSFARTTDGRFIVTGFARPGTVAVFNAAGAWTGDVGRRGGGPGEFQQPARVSRWLGDSLLVLDVALNRVSVLGPDLTFGRSMVLPSPATRLLGLVGGSIALSRPPSGTGRALMFLEGDGRVREFGPIVTADGLDFQRELARGPSGDLLTARADRYDIEQFSPRGVSLAVFRRGPSWFPAADGRHRVDPMKEPMPPATAGLLSAGDGTVWHLTAVTRTPFSPPVKRDRNGQPYVDLSLVLAAKNIRVELVDLRAGTVVASGVIEGLLWPGDTNALVARLRDDRERGSFVEIFELAVARPEE